MTDVVSEFDATLEAEDGTVWSARVCARPAEDKWEAWVEFVPLSAGERAVRTPPETTQAARHDIEYWASGLTTAYLEGALDRARERPAIVEIEGAPPLFDAPAATIAEPAPVPAPTPRPLLDPYEVYAQGEEILVGQLAALGTEHLRDIALGYELISAEAAPIASRADLTTRILAAARSGPIRHASR